MIEMDSKFDDGRPGTGKFLAACPAPQCVVGNDTQSAVYASNDEKTCRVDIILPY